MDEDDGLGRFQKGGVDRVLSAGAGKGKESGWEVVLVQGIANYDGFRDVGREEIVAVKC